MESRRIASAYDQIADQWRDERFDNQNGIAQHKRALALLDSESAGYALNVGCGCNSRLNVLMRDYGLEIEGIDVSPRMIELARQSDPCITLYEADVCKWEPPRRYDFITAWDSIWHIPLEEQRPVMIKLMASLRPGGVFIFSAGGLDAPSEHRDSTMGPEVYYSTLGIPGILEVIDDADCVCRHLELDQYPQSHLYVIAQRAH